MAEPLPDRLTHYYREVPFHTLSDLDDVEIARVLADIAARGEPEYRLTRLEYLPRRREIEAEMRRQFVSLGGRPVRGSPHYAIFGTFSLYEQKPALKSVAAPLNAIPSEVVSFTLTDSYFNFSDRNLRGIPIPPRSYHGRVFSRDDLTTCVEEFGLPGERWRHEPDRVFDVYIEAQIWDDAVLGAFA